MHGKYVSALIGFTSAFALTNCKCENSAFTGSSKVRRKPDNMNAAAAISRSLDTVTSHKIWVAAVKDNSVSVSRLAVEENEVKNKKTWSGLTGSGGTRTYVTEGGFLATRFPHIYFIDPEKTPEGPITPSHTITEATNRICVASYKRNNKRFMIAAWGAGSYKEFPMEDTPPYKPIWDRPSASGSIDLGGASWGYSCFIDQKRLIFYSQYWLGTKVGALKLDPVGLVDPQAVAPNGNFTSSTPEIAPFTLGPKPGVIQSYSLSGDSNGNVLNGGAYTMANDPISKTTWISTLEGKDIWVVPEECLTTEKNCTGHQKFSSSVGPLSALKDGRIVGLKRTTGEIYLLSLVDPKDRSKRINSTLITKVDGDPYMYTDFTGATLYVTNSEQTIDLAEGLNFNAEKNVKNLLFSWVAKAGGSDQWQSLMLEMRCYTQGGPKPDYQEVSSVGAATARIKVSLDQCKNKKFNTVDVKVSQLDSADTMTGIEKVEIAPEQ
jgi:hypothetical protein